MSSGAARRPKFDVAPRLATQVAEILKRRILSGELAPGDKLPPELTLAADLAVNRFTVREAMNQLEQLRLIERRPGAGTVVLSGSTSTSTGRWPAPLATSCRAC